MTVTQTGKESSSGLSDTDLRTIVARSATVSERLDGPFSPASPEGEIVDARLRTWRAAVGGELAQFLHRLRWDGWDETTVRAALGNVDLTGNAPLPAWADLLSDVVARGPAESHERFFSDSYAIPFQEFLAPFVLVARDRLKFYLGRTVHEMSPEAHAAMERDLLQNLSAQAAEALYLEFSIERSKTQSPFARLLSRVDKGTDVYQQYIDQLLDPHGRGLYNTYPVLARILSVTTLQWVEATAEMVERLVADRHSLQSTFGDTNSLGPVMSIQSSLSDPHAGRRTVMALTFNSGVKVVYKPKDLGTEASYDDLMAWLKSRDLSLDLRRMKVLNRGTHGWVEYVHPGPCPDQAGACRYYRRAGMLLALFHALEVTDCHRENIIASGEYPVLVDMETLMHHRGIVEDQSDDEVHTGAGDTLVNSVLRIGLLPTWNVHQDQSIAYDVSGLGGAVQQAVPFKSRDWRETNTDAMTLDYTSVIMPVGPNVATLGDVPLHLEDYADDLLTGFEEMYRFLMKHRAELLADGGPLSSLAGQHVRFIFRSTRVYAVLQRMSFAPKQLGDGADWSLGFEVLTRAAMPSLLSSRTEGKASMFWPVFKEERRAMEDGDIPFFLARPSDNGMAVQNTFIENCFEEPSFDRVVRRLAGFDEEDLLRQTGLIRGTVYSLVARSAVLSVSAHGHKDDEGESLTRDELVDEAVRLANIIENHAVPGPDGSATWIVPQYLPQAERYQLAQSGFDLYDGAPGVALFMGALYRVTGDKRYRDLGLRSVQLLGQDLRRFGDLTARFMPIGGAAGLGSVVYSLLRSGDLLDNPDLVDDALSFAMLMSDSRIADDTTFDVISGAAGAILGLLPLYEAKGNPLVLDRARACGMHLLEMRIATESGLRAWPTIAGLALTGFSHGTAGIAYALTRLYETTHEEAFKVAAREAIAYEDSLLNESEGNWPDLRPDVHGGFMGSWCHGAPGIGLARIGGLGTESGVEIERDIEVAVQTTLMQGSAGVESVCCGIFGRSEILLAASQRMRRPDLAEAGLRNVSQVVRRARDRGRYTVHALMPAGLHAPGFFQGHSGIGYSLLRFAEPDVLPSVLLWE